MTRLSHPSGLAALVSVTALLCSCTASTESEDATYDDTAESSLSIDESDARLSAGPRARRIEAIKRQIVAISKANQTRQDNLPAVNAELRPLISRLLRIAPVRTQAQNLVAVQGTWYNLWSNLGYGSRAPDLTKIFQVVRNGYYYNISGFTAPNGTSAIGALRGAYAPIPNSLAIRFTRNAFLPGSLSGKTGAEIAQLADSVETGATMAQDVPGPVGLTGDLSVLYVDATLRISGGSQTPVFDNNGNVQIPGQFDLLFVLERPEGILP